jgi:hypothetical protein
MFGRQISRFLVLKRVYINKISNDIFNKKVKSVFINIRFVRVLNEQGLRYSEISLFFGSDFESRLQGYKSDSLLLESFCSVLMNFCQARSQHCEKRLLASSCLSVCPSVRMD